MNPGVDVIELSEFIEKNRDALGNKGGKQPNYERKFAEEILARVPGLNLADVSTQTGFRDLERKPRKIDFTIREGEGVRIAIEVDGFDKTGRGAGMSSHEFHDWSLREISIAAAGWRVLRFANSLFTRQPEHCIKAIELTLEAERNVAMQSASSAELRKRIESIEAEARESREQLQSAAHGEEREAQLLARIEELESQRNDLSTATLSAENQHVLEEIDVERRAENRRLDQELRDTIVERDDLRDENWKMKAVIFAAVVLVIAATVIIVSITGGDGSGRSGSADGSEAALAATKCSEAISWDQTDEAVGTTATVRGPVVGATFANDTEGSPTYLNIGRDYPDDERFAVVIFGEDRQNFRGRPEDTYSGKEIAVEGEVTTFNGVREIIINHPNDLAVC